MVVNSTIDVVVVLTTIPLSHAPLANLMGPLAIRLDVCKQKEEILYNLDSKFDEFCRVSITSWLKRVLSTELRNSSIISRSNNL
ncbi:hypothetical protein DERF_012460 [Dermatophagoides farinae]|uniref:Uncharacterized protein n=1 Tax=Dermatophagoides farinae TaxID=6954 RepID=A0A922HQ13_DERFA|nr:hypothetical protein DERF_012460 [Dermatophagoides farinae]